MATNIQPRRAPGGTQPFVTLNPAPVIANRAPTTFDNYEPSTIWIQQVDASGNPVNDIWLLASVQNGQANWIQIMQGGGDIFENIYLPNTNSGGTDGVIYFNDIPFFHNYDPVNAGNSVFIGQNAGNFSATSPSDGNVGIGSNALANVTTGAFLTAVGENAGASLTTGNDCVFIGQNAGINATTGSYNTVVGCQSYNASEELPTGSSNCIFGYNAAGSLTTGSNNVLIGENTAAEMTSGSTNTIVGHQAAIHIGTGQDNVIIGYQAGDGYTGGELGNIAIGTTGVAGDNFICRIGQPGIITDTYLVGDVMSTASIIGGTTCGALGDPGEPVFPTSIEFTNTIEAPVSSGVMTVLSTNTNNGTSSGWLKLYFHGATVYVPFFNSITPA